MIRIGIVGAENTHTAAIAKLVNVDKLVKGAAVVALWGETAEFAAKAAAAGNVRTIVKNPADMIGLIDAVMIDHRHAKYHLPAAEPFLAARLPLFIDKPFCYRAAEGKKFLQRARRLGVPVTSFSVLPEQKSFAKLRAAIARSGPVRTLVTTGPCDINSIHGGVFFYGIHHVGAVLKLLGNNVKTVQVHAFKGADRHTATLEYADGPLVTMNLLKGYNKVGFHTLAACENGIVSHLHEDDENFYAAGAAKFIKMFKTGVEPEKHEDILMVVRVLEAMEKSIKTGKRERI